VFSAGFYDDLKDLKDLKSDVKKVGVIAKIVNELQKERGLSNAYLEDKAFKTKLGEQRKKVDTAFKNFFNSDFQNIKNIKITQQQLQATRQLINKFDISIEHSSNFYSTLIKSLHGDSLKLTIDIPNSFIKKKLRAYENLTSMKESLAQILSSLNTILIKKVANKEILHKIIYADAIYNSSSDRFEKLASADNFLTYKKLLSSQNYKWIQKKIDKYTKTPDVMIDETQVELYGNAQIVITKLYELEQVCLSVIDQYILEKSHKITFKLITVIIIFITTMMVSFWLGLTLKDNMIKNISLLNEYKNAVDRSSIVSKTNKRGIITYVNNKFCSISGYSAKELLGKPHKIVRHPDMPKSIFKDMWETILNKKPWYGIVKNKKKNGDSYTVEATINPILNHVGEIEEFIAIRNDITDVINLHEEIENTQEDLIYRMGEISETRSKETGFHVRRVAKYSEILALYYGLDKNETKYLTLASPMHDIGKVGIPDNILNKPGKLTQEEWKLMKTHSSIGYELFKNSNKPLLKAAAIIAHQHHEKYDGSGYPKGLKGDDIHIYGRITAIADVFDALGSKRSYKEAWEDEDIFNFLKQESGKHFDPKLIDIFFAHLDDFIKVRQHYT
jgi:PAS domain S-box-containing protein